MSRDGVDKQYAKMNISKETEAIWLEELTSRKIESLNLPGNWSAIHFFIHHGDLQRIENIMAVTPKGKLWEKCAFLEEFLKYLSIVDESSSVSTCEKGLKYILEHSNKLLSSDGSFDTRKRILAIVDEASKNLSKLNERKNRA